MERSFYGEWTYNGCEKRCTTADMACETDCEPDSNGVRPGPASLDHCNNNNNKTSNGGPGVRADWEGRGGQVNGCRSLTRPARHARSQTGGERGSTDCHATARCSLFADDDTVAAFDDGQLYQARRVFIQSPRWCSEVDVRRPPAARPPPSNGVSPTQNGGVARLANGVTRPAYLCLTDDLLPLTPPRGGGLTPDSPEKSPRRRLHTISENLGSLLRPLRRSLQHPSGAGDPRAAGVMNGGGHPRANEGDGRPAPAYRRCNSTPNCLDELGRTTGLPDSDSDNDDYGFLSNSNLHLHSSLPCASLSPAMQKAKGSSTAQKILPKKWRRSNKLTSSKSTPSLWRAEGSCVWGSVSGRKVVLAATNLVHLGEMERLALQKVALSRLQRLGLGCAITVPKEWVDTKRTKRTGFSLKRPTISGGLLDNFKDKSKDKDGRDPGGSGWVFGVPLAKCIANDAELRRPKPSLLKERRDSLDMQRTIRPCRKSSGSSGGAISSDSLSESDSKSTGSNLLDALSLSSSSQLEAVRRDGGGGVGGPGVAPHPPQVPYAASVCFRHLETYGVRVLGIFRIGSSKKRTKQLRDEFDTGRDVRLSEDHSPHDIAALLKEFFRDLPDPLLTRDLYTAFICTRKMESREKRLRALHLLIALMPRANRDTLWALLNFLQVIVHHSTSAVDEQGNELPGNKMGSHNLATLFGPNILHTARGGEFQVESLERAEERQDIISVVKEIIDHHKQIYELPVDLYDEVMRLMQETNPEAVDHLLRLKSMSTLGGGGDVDPADTSSSVYEESESSASVPHSPTYSADHQVAPRCLLDVPPALVPVAAMRSPAGVSLSAPAEGRLAATPAASPRISPSPKAMRHSTPLGGSIAAARSTLTVPSTKLCATAAAAVVVAPPGGGRWYLDSPPSSPLPVRLRPSSVIVSVTADTADETTLDGTSSTHRPLGLLGAHRRPASMAALPAMAAAHCAAVAAAAAAPARRSWHSQRWQHWQQLAADSSDDFHEQETLV